MTALEERMGSVKTSNLIGNNLRWFPSYSSGMTALFSALDIITYSNDLPIVDMEKLISTKYINQVKKQ